MAQGKPSTNVQSRTATEISSKTLASTALGQLASIALGCYREANNPGGLLTDEFDKIPYASLEADTHRPRASSMKCEEPFVDKEDVPEHSEEPYFVTRPLDSQPKRESHANSRKKTGASIQNVRQVHTGVAKRSAIYCALCDRTFGTRSHFNRHITSCHGLGKKLYICDSWGCPEFFSNRSDLENHVLEKHGEVVCVDCGLSFPSDRKYKTHAYRHSHGHFRDAEKQLRQFNQR